MNKQPSAPQAPKILIFAYIQGGGKKRKLRFLRFFAFFWILENLRFFAFFAFFCVFFSGEKTQLAFFHGLAKAQNIKFAFFRFFSKSRTKHH